jgi:hypothetical protein
MVSPDVIEQFSDQRAATFVIGVNFGDLAAWSVLQNV